MSARDPRQWMRDIDRIHRNQGWAVIGYNYCVALDGTILEGCGMARGIHSPPVNTTGFGVCFLQPSTPAGVPTSPITDRMRTSGRALYEWLCSVTGRRLSMTWHGATFPTACPGPDLTAWVRSGMPAPLPPTPPPAIEDTEMITSGVSAAGHLHVFIVTPNRRSITYTWQRAGESNWNGGQAGQRVAGPVRFADAPQGRTIRGIAASLSSAGALNVHVTYDNGAVGYTWQRRGQTGWEGGGPGRVAALQPFSPAP